MVKIEENQLVIVIETENPKEELNNYVSGLIDVLQGNSKQEDKFYMFELLRQITHCPTTPTSLT